MVSESGETEWTPALKDRETMGHWASQRIEKNELRAYQAEKNNESLDGLPGLRVAARDAGKRVWIMKVKASMRKIGAQTEALILGVGIGVFVILLLQWSLTGQGHVSIRA